MLHRVSRSFAFVISGALAAGAFVALFALPTAPHPYVRAVSMERDLRLEPDAFARRNGIARDELQSRYGASGLIRCGKAVGSGQITLRSDIVTTAAHVFFAPGGKLRADSCTFEPALAPGQPVSIDMSSIVAGSHTPMEARATLDWAVARIANPSPTGAPYTLGVAPRDPAAVTMLGGGNGGAGRLGIENCSTRRQTALSPEGIRELSFDCSAAHGGSGAALLDTDGKMIGIFVGYRSIDATAAMPFSDRHYNFAITVEGPFRAALMQEAARPALSEAPHATPAPGRP